MKDKELSDKYKDLLELYRKQSNTKLKKLNSLYQKALKNKKEIPKYIFKILLSFNITNNEIIIENQAYKIFFSKFLDISKKIIADDKQISPEIIIKNDDLEQLGEFNQIIKLYIKISSLFKGESLQIFFNFLNHKYFALNDKFCFKNKSDLTNLMLLDKIYKISKNEKLNNGNNNKNIDEFEIKIILEDEKKKEDNKSKEIENNQIKDIYKEKTDPKKEELKKISIEEEIKKKETEIKNNINMNQKGKNDNKIINIPLEKNNKINEPKSIINKIKEEFISNQSNKNIKVNNQNNKKEVKELAKNNIKETIHEFDLRNKSNKGKRAKSFKYGSNNKNKELNLNQHTKYRTESNKKNKETNLIKENNKNDLIERVNNLKKDLVMAKKVGVYLKEQKEKYLLIYKNNEILNNENFSNSLFDLNFHKSKNSKFLIFKKAAKNLKEYFNKPEENYNKNFGFVVLNNIAYFYLNDTEEQENIVLFDSEKIKKADYGINEKKDDKFSYVSYSSSNKSNSIEDKEVEYQLYNGIQFKKNFVDFFDITFKLQHLPSIFFSIVIKENKQIDTKKKEYEY